jgi:hypothetical protein
MPAADWGFVRTALVDVVLGDDAVGAAALRATAERAAWTDLVQLATRWRLIPQLREAIARDGVAKARIDPPALECLRAESIVHAAESAAIVRHGAEALRLLSEAGVQAVAIKGVAAIATLYGGSSRRMVADVDLVIEEAQLATVRTVLERCGYRDISPPFEEHVASIGFSRHLHNYARTFAGDRGELDVHWQFGPRPPQALAAGRILERSILATVEGRTLRVAGPVEFALLGLHHALRSSFAAYSTAKDLADLRAWWEREGEGRGSELVAAAAGAGLGSSLLALARAIVRRNAAHPLARGVEALDALLPAAQRREAERLETFVEQNLRGEAPDDATVELFAPVVLLRSLAGPVLTRGRLRGAAPVAGATPRRKPLFVRVRNRIERGLRIGRELLQPQRVATYRAVARAQSRFH